MSAQEVLALRIALCANGYTPLPLYGKVPPAFGKNNTRKGLDRWQDLNNISRAQCEMWARLWPDAENTGILTRLTPAFDLDILYPEAAEAVEAFVRERVEERGYFLVRIGLPPKRAFLFRTLVPFDKIIANVVRTNGKPEKIEFLANGQQIVAAGIHPDTGLPYNWHGGEPWTVKHEDLPYIDAEEAQQLVDDSAEFLVRSFDYTRAADRPKKTRRKGNGIVSDQLANEADWQVLITNILKGDALHDSLRDLAAKMITTGTGAGAVVNQLRALMETSTAPHDGRWRERFDEIPRLVDSALDKYAPEQEQPAQSFPPFQPPPPPLQPPPPGTAGAGSTGPQPLKLIDETLKIFREWLLLDSDVPVLAMLGTVAANMLPGDPVWLGLIAPPSSAKTEMLVTLLKIPNTELVGTLTPAGLLSASPQAHRARGATGGVLRKIGKFGFLVLKDFGSILSMQQNVKAELLAALREIYDGRWTRVVGSDGGKVYEWTGKIGLLFGCTRIIDSYYGVISSLGDRFLLCRMEPNVNQLLHAAKHVGTGTAHMRAKLVEAVTNLFATSLQLPRVTTPEEWEKLDEIVRLAVRLRGSVERDYRTKELENIYGAEGPARFGLTLERLLSGLDCLSVDRTAAFEVVRSVALDSVPPNRRRIYEHLQNVFPNWAETRLIAKDIRLPTVTVRRALEELLIYKLIEKDKIGKADAWRIA